jgi:hypothetical protein
MFNSIRRLLETIWGLLVEDGSLAVGIVVALAVTSLAAAAMPARVDHLGWLLAAMLLVLIVTNLYRTGRSAAMRA